MASATVPPLTARLVAALFFSRTVIVEVVTPFARIAVGAAVTVDFESEAAAVVVTACPTRSARGLPATSFTLSEAIRLLPV